MERNCICIVLRSVNLHRDWPNVRYSEPLELHHDLHGRDVPITAYKSCSRIVPSRSRYLLNLILNNMMTMSLVVAAINMRFTRFVSFIRNGRNVCHSNTRSNFILADCFLFSSRRNIPENPPTFFSGRSAFPAVFIQVKKLGTSTPSIYSRGRLADKEVDNEDVRCFIQAVAWRCTARPSYHKYAILHHSLSLVQIGFFLFPVVFFFHL